MEEVLEPKHGIEAKILTPPFINDEGKVDLKASKLWQNEKRKPRLFHNSTGAVTPRGKLKGVTYFKSEEDKKPYNNKLERKALRKEKIRQLKGE